MLRKAEVNVIVAIQPTIRKPPLINRKWKFVQFNPEFWKDQKNLHIVVF